MGCEDFLELKFLFLFFAMATIRRHGIFPRQLFSKSSTQHGFTVYACRNVSIAAQPTFQSNNARRQRGELGMGTYHDLDFHAAKLSTVHLSSAVNDMHIRHNVDVPMSTTLVIRPNPTR